MIVMTLLFLFYLPVVLSSPLHPRDAILSILVTPSSPSSWRHRPRPVVLSSPPASSSGHPRPVLLSSPLHPRDAIVLGRSSSAGLPCPVVLIRLSSHLLCILVTPSSLSGCPRPVVLSILVTPSFTFVLVWSSSPLLSSCP
jgi:hypothetical protein